MKKIFFFPFCLCIVFFTTSCKKDESQVGKDGLSSDAFLNSEAIDTFGLECYMYVEDSLLSSNLTSTLLGSYNDPVFGQFSSEIFTQFNLSGLSPDFGDLSTVKIDSFVLGLEYSGYYGKLDAQFFQVFELQEDLSIDSTYYSFQTKNVSSQDLVQTGKNSIIPDPVNPTIIDDIEVESQLRLHLDTNYARNLMSEAINNPTTFESNANFLTYFKGFNIKTNTIQNPGEGAMLYFNLTDPLSKLTIYYTQDGLQKAYDFLINKDCADFHHITINNSTAVQNVIDNPTMGSSQFYAQANKSRAVVKFTSIDKIPKNSIIQYAQLELPVSYYSSDLLFPSSIITVSTKISDTDKNLYNLNVISEFNNYDKNYVVDVRDYVQQVVNGQIENHGIFLSPAKMLSSAERIVFNGVNTSNKKHPKLKIIYTTY